MVALDPFQLFLAFIFAIVNIIIIGYYIQSKSSVATKVDLTSLYDEMTSKEVSAEGIDLAKISTSGVKFSSITKAKLIYNPQKKIEFVLCPQCANQMSPSSYQRIKRCINCGLGIGLAIKLEVDYTESLTAKNIQDPFSKLDQIECPKCEQKILGIRIEQNGRCPICFAKIAYIQDEDGSITQLNIEETDDLLSSNNDQSLDKNFIKKNLGILVNRDNILFLECSKCRNIVSYTEWRKKHNKKCVFCHNTIDEVIIGDIKYELICKRCGSGLSEPNEDELCQKCINQEMGSQEVEEESYYCSNCLTLNSISEETCTECDTPKIPLDEIIPDEEKVFKEIEEIKSGKRKRGPCPHCGEMTIINKKFCMLCGKDLTIIKSVLTEKKACPNCSKEIDETNKFCMYCGFRFYSKPTCVKCGREINLEKKFCGYCGTSVLLRPESLSSGVREEKGDKCPKCGRTVNMEKKFCGYCGTPLSWEHKSSLSEESKGVQKKPPKVNVEKNEAQKGVRTCLTCGSKNYDVSATICIYCGDEI